MRLRALGTMGLACIGLFLGLDAWHARDRGMSITTAKNGAVVRLGPADFGLCGGVAPAEADAIVAAQTGYFWDYTLHDITQIITITPLGESLVTPAGGVWQISNGTSQVLCVGADFDATALQRSQISLQADGWVLLSSDWPEQALAPQWVVFGPTHTPTRTLTQQLRADETPLLRATDGYLLVPRKGRWQGYAR